MAPEPTFRRHPKVGWRKRLRAFLHPIDPEKRAAVAGRWSGLPAELRTPSQVSGRQFTHCGFTTGASYCSFHCTHCYLPENANRVPLPTMAEMRGQIAANRKLLGPGGGFQITGGDVADAYWRAGRPDELIEIVRLTVDSGLVPILMTHGQTLIEQPDFLERLILEGGLREVSVHIDTTQAGRRGFPIRAAKSEADLHPVREAFTQLALETQRKTGIALRFAMTFTVTRNNLADVPEVLRWFLATPERAAVWRMLAFLPEADTGRTIMSGEPVMPELVWERIREGTGLPLKRDAVQFGHADCNSWAPLLAAGSDIGNLPLLPGDGKSTRLFSSLLDAIGGISLAPGTEDTLPYRLAGALVRRPLLMANLLVHAVRLIFMGIWPWRIVMRWLRGAAQVTSIYMHNFMNSEQVASAPTDPTVQARLDGCVFKGAIRRDDGSWEAVSMCSMNKSEWGKLFDQRIAGTLSTIGSDLSGIRDGSIFQAKLMRGNAAGK